jgi:cyanophycin synthetase
VSTFEALAAAPKRTGLLETETAALERLYDALAGGASRSTNERHFYEAAFALDVPVLTLPGRILQFGWGSAARRFASSTSDATPAIASRIAGDKALTSALLRDAGLPVPPQVPLSDLAGAKAAAAALGWPVVLKVRDLEQGAGVAPGLQGPAELERAFARLSAHGRPMVLEKHVPGRDYRINVLHGRAVGAVERVPGGVTGDGRRSVADLVAATNRDPRRSDRRFSVMKPLVLDEEAGDVLAAAGLDQDAVPAAGRFVSLRRTANVTTGGHTVPVLDRLHPDNARLCEMAARQLGLDIAGIDLIAPDIARSWRETGAAICEVNAKPQIGLTYPEIFKTVLRSTVSGDGRLPVGLVLTPPGRVSVPGAVARRLARRGLCTGLSTAGGQAIDGWALHGGRSDPLAGTRALLLQPTLQAAVVAAEAEEIGRLGLPVDRLAALACLEQPQDPARLAAILRRVAPHLRGACLVPAGTRTERAALAALGAGRVQAVPQSRLEIAFAEALCPTAPLAVTAA